MLWTGLLLFASLMAAVFGGLWWLRVMQRQAIARLPDEGAEAAITEPAAEEPALESLAAELPTRRLVHAVAFVESPSVLLHRSEHVTDKHHGGRDFTREIKNWQNYKTPAGLVLPSSPALVESSSPPPDWGDGEWDFDLASLHGPGQVFIREHAKKLPQAGLRHSDFPSWWMNLRVLGTQYGIVPSRSGDTVTWTDAFPGCDLSLTSLAHGFSDEFTLKSYSAPTRYRYSLLLAHGLTHVVAADSVKVYNGTELAFTVKAPWARDSSGLDELSSRSIRCWFEAGEPLTVGGRTFPTFYKVLDAGEFAAAVLPVRSGPTTTISGTSAIEDAWLNGFDATQKGYNLGGSPATDTGWVGGGTSLRTAMWRVATASIPSGTVSAFRHISFRRAISGSGSVGAYLVAAGATWQEGSSNGAAEANVCCWNYARTSGTPWPGGANGCTISGSDFDADASPPTQSFDLVNPIVDAATTTTLKATWPGLWKSGARINNGIVYITQDAGGADHFWGVRSTEYATDPTKVPYFEIDYTAANIAAAVHYYRQMRRR